jgi:hypothetical protein
MIIQTVKKVKVPLVVGAPNFAKAYRVSQHMFNHKVTKHGTEVTSKLHYSVTNELIEVNLSYVVTSNPFTYENSDGSVCECTELSYPEGVNGPRFVVFK